jgi:hypothetical protein
MEMEADRISWIIQVGQMSAICFAGMLENLRCIMPKQKAVQGNRCLLLNSRWQDPLLKCARDSWQRSKLLEEQWYTRHL